MNIEKAEGTWQETSAEALSGIKAWREAHPKATLRDIEAAVDERLGRLRRQIVEDVALASEAVEWGTGGAGRVVCPVCGAGLEARGKAKRELTTGYDQSIKLERRYGVCPVCQTGLFPPG